MEGLLFENRGFGFHKNCLIGLSEMSTEKVRRACKVLRKKYSIEIIAALFERDGKYITQLSEERGIPYTTIEQRINELEAAGLVKCSETLHAVMKRPIKEVKLRNFRIVLSPRTIHQIIRETEHVST